MEEVVVVVKVVEGENSTGNAYCRKGLGRLGMICRLHLI